MPRKVFHRSFAGGEVSPEMASRIDDARYQSGLARARNFVIRPYGPAQKRPGWEFCAAARSHDTKARVLPFRFSGTQQLTIQCGLRPEYPGSSAIPGYFRFHAGGATVLYASDWSSSTSYQVGDQVMQSSALYRCTTAHTNITPPNTGAWKLLEYVANQPFTRAGVADPIGSYDTVTGRFTVSGHGLVDEDQVYLTVGTGTMPGPFLGDGTPYYVRKIDNDTFELDNVTPFVSAITGGPAPAAGVLLWKEGSTDSITFASDHNLVDDDPIAFTIDSGASLPAPLQVGVRYYARKFTDKQIRVRAEPGGPTLILSTAGSFGGSFRLNYAYEPGDMVSQGGTVFYCRQNPVVNGSPSVAPGTESCWYALPATRELEVPNGLAVSEDELFEMTYSQSLDVMTLCTVSVLQSELRRYGATRWTWGVVALGTSIAAPGTPTVSPTYGATIALDNVISTTAYLRATLPAGKVSHGLAQGDAVDVDGLSAKGITSGTYLVADQNGAGGEADQFSLEHPQTGQAVTATSTGAVTGTCRVTTLGADASNSYLVTAIADDGRESQPSPVGSATNNLDVDGASNLISWAAVTGAVRYRVYKLLPQSGLYGRIGESDGTTFLDDGIGPDIGITPPKLDTSMGLVAGGAPRAVCNYQGRRAFGGTLTYPQDFWATRSNTESDLSYHLPVQANDRIRRQLSSREACTIRHLVPTSRLIALTDTTEFTLSPVNSDVLAPDSFVAIPHSAVGASPAQPLVVDGIVLFVGGRDGRLYGFGYDDKASGFKPVDLSLRAAHLFDGFSIADLAFSRSPLSIAWATSSGAFLGLTVIPDQGVLGWHWHDTDGVVESCCTIQEDGEDRLYAMIRRTIGGNTKRYLERMGSLRAQSLVNSFYVDSGLTLTSSGAVTTVSGLGHLEGKVVQVLANGRKQAQRTVSSGQITLATPLPAGSNVVHVGLGYTAELQTLPAVLEIEAFAQGRPRNVNRCFLSVLNSGAFQVGPSSSDLVPDGVAVAGALYSGEVDVTLPASWSGNGQVFIRSSDPLPLTVSSMTLNLEVGG